MKFGVERCLQNNSADEAVENGHFLRKGQKREGGRRKGGGEREEKREETESFQMVCRTLKMVKLGPSGGGGSTGVRGQNFDRKSYEY